MLLALLLPVTAAAGPPDLPELARKYGWSTVASVVQAATTGDVSVSDAHVTLKQAGLDRLDVPVVVDAALTPVGTLGPLTGCGWNQGVTCSLSLPPGTQRPLAWRPRCGDAKGIVDSAFIGAPLTVVVEPRPTAETAGTAHIGDLQTCWLAGGDRVRLVPVGAAPPPRPTLLSFAGVSERQARILLDAHGARLAECLQGHGVLTLVFADGVLTSVRVIRDGGVQQDETACAAASLEGVTVAAPGAATVELVAPPR